jgi:RimJ/RimL family protein N-acetyltransferase
MMMNLMDFDLVGESLSIPPTTRSLNLVPSTQSLASAETNDKKLFSELLNSSVPDSWPPSIVGALDSDDASPWHNYYLLKLDESGKQSTVVGVAGVKIWAPDEHTAQVGCAIVPEFHGLHLGEEIMRALSIWALELKGIARCICDVPKGHVASQKSLERAGFVGEPHPSSGESLRFELNKSS